MKLHTMHTPALFALCIAACACPAFCSDSAPLWLREAAARKIPEYDVKTPAVTLFEDAQMQVEPGRSVLTRRWAIKVLSKEGRNFAFLSQDYIVNAGKIRDLQAWIMFPDGDIKKAGKEQVFEQAVSPNDVYDEARFKGIDLRAKVDVGSVVGFELVEESRTIFTQTQWAFQRRLPALQSRFSMTLPPGWKLQSRIFNHASFEPNIVDGAYVWEVDDLPYIENEVASPDMSSLAPRLAISYFPAPGSNPGEMVTFQTWADVGHWLSSVAAPQAVSNDALSRKVKELTSKAPTDWDKLWAIAAYTQFMKHISVQAGLAQGYGYRPHSATEVFAKEYGDCKDISNLLRTMLKEAGYTSYLVSLHIGGRNYVRDEWPSPHQFNHKIIAIRVPDSVKAPAVYVHPTLGRLLFFDPLNGVTPLGELPFYEQGNLALIDGDEQGKLLRLPIAEPEQNLSTRHIEAVLNPDGSLTAAMQERSSGSAAAAMRGIYYGFSRTDFESRVEHWVARGSAAARVSDLRGVDGFRSGQFTLQCQLAAPAAAQVMNGRLMVFKPVLLGRYEVLNFTPRERKNPILLNPGAFEETVRVKLPAGFRVDEMPDPEKLESPFGRYTAAFEVRNDVLIMNRRLETNAATVPPTQYAGVRDFYQKIISLEQTPVVLARQ